MMFGGSTSMYINYRAALGGTPTHWIWNAGSSSSFARFTLGRLDAEVFYDRNNTGYYVDPASTSVLSEIRVNEYIRHNGDTNTYIRLQTDDLQLVAGGRQVIRMDEGTNPDILQLGDSATYTRNEGHLIVGQTAISYTVNDNTPLVGSNTNNRVHINGSIQLTSNNDAIVFGRGTSSFMKDEEIGFGWGGGWYMTDGTYLRVRNNKILYSTGEFWASRFNDVNNTGYYGDFASTSNINILQAQSIQAQAITVKDNQVRTYRHSGSDFTSGTLVQTDIPSSATNGASFVLEATGKSYSGDTPFSFMAQGYLYSNTIINSSGVHFGKPGFTQMKVFNNGGTLAFWWPRVSYWNSFSVNVRDAGGSEFNRVTSVGNSTEPTGTKKITITMKVSAVYNQNINVGDLYAN